MHHSLSGFAISKERPFISHIFFANDSLLFSKIIVKKMPIFGHYCVSMRQRRVNQSIMRNLLFLLVQIQMSRCNRLLVRFLPLPMYVVIWSILVCRLLCLIIDGKRWVFIKDQVWRHLQNWKGKLFSVGGRETLIKVVVQVVSCYTMNCFRLPKGLISYLHRLVARYWWNGSDDSHKLHWVSWETMCRPKCLGGLGFHDLKHFNRSLLAKQGWHLFQHLSSLLGRVLKARYFKNYNFLHVHVGWKSSFIWQSLLWGQDLLIYGLR